MHSQVKRIDSSVLEEVSRLITPLIGLHYPPDRLVDLERGLTSAGRDFGFDNPDAFARWVLTASLDRAAIEKLASHLTVGETYYFRDEGLFTALRERVLPSIIAGRGEGKKFLRIWSAGCSTGEEPYSIAILLHRIIPDIKDWNITILATDINPNSIHKARTGVYTQWSFRGTPQWVKDIYFTLTETGDYVLRPFIKDMVAFSHLNFAVDPFPSLANNTNAMDIIFCRNVVMYFTEELGKRTINSFYKSLIDGGYLVVNPAEAYRTVSSHFKPINIDGAIMYMKGGAKPNADAFPLSFDTQSYDIKETVPPPVRAERHPPARLAIKINEYSFPEPVSAASVGAPDLPAASEKERKGAEVTAKASYDAALTLYNSGEYAGAVKALDGCRDALSLALLSRACANRGALDDARKWCLSALSIDSLNAANHFLLATIDQERGALDEAVQSLKKALYMDNDFAIAYFVLGTILQRKGDAAAARKNFTNAVEILSRSAPGSVVNESDGITAGRLSEIIRATMN